MKAWLLILLFSAELESPFGSSICIASSASASAGYSGSRHGASMMEVDRAGIEAYKYALH